MPKFRRTAPITVRSQLCSPRDQVHLTDRLGAGRSDRLAGDPVARPDNATRESEVLPPRTGSRSKAFSIRASTS